MPTETVRAELLERYRSLALPTKREEHWRFTDLADFDPDAWTAEVGDTRRCDATVIRRARCCRHRDPRREWSHDRVCARRDPLRVAHRRSSAARLARLAGRQASRTQRSGVGARPSRPRPRRGRARQAAVPARDEHRRRWRALLADPRRRRAGQPVHADRGARLGLCGARWLRELRRRDRRARGRQGRVRQRPEPLAADLALLVVSRAGSSRTRSSTGSPAASARGAARSGSRTTSSVAARPHG